MKLHVLLFSLLIAAPAASPAQANIEPVLDQLDRASLKFKNATADFKWDYYEKVVRDTTTQTGNIYFERSGTSTQMGAIVSRPGKPELVEYKGGILRYYDPANNQITLVKAGSNQAEYEGFLTLGFGGSGKDLDRAWKITDQGSETLPDGKQQVKTEKLDLVAKDPGVAKNFTHVTIWVDLARGVSLKQIFYDPSGNIRTSYFSNIKLNTTVKHGPFELPTNVPTVTH